MDGFFVCIAYLFILPSLIVGIIALIRASYQKKEIQLLQKEMQLLRGELIRRLDSQSPAPHLEAPVQPTPIIILPPHPATPPHQPPVAPSPVPLAAELEKPIVEKAAPLVSEQPVIVEPVVPTPPPHPPIAHPIAPPPPPKPKKPPVPLEQRIIRLAIGIGGLALALAGIFLVKVAFSHNFLNPTIRVIIGSLFGALLLVATTGLAVLLSLRQGPFVAFLGLVGGFLTPALINTGHPSALSLFGYLFLLHVGLITVTRARQWAWIAALTVLASLGWVALWLITQPWNPADGPVLGAFLLLSTAVVAIGSAFQETAWHSNPLLARLLTKGPILRWASLFVMLITIIKVFLFDTSDLSDIFRVLSFAGLGISLILLAFLYHYFVFPKPAPSSIPENPPTP